MIKRYVFLEQLFNISVSATLHVIHIKSNRRGHEEFIILDMKYIATHDIIEINNTKLFCSR